MHDEIRGVRERGRSALDDPWKSRAGMPGEQNKDGEVVRLLPQCRQQPVKALKPVAVLFRCLIVKPQRI